MILDRRSSEEVQGATKNCISVTGYNSVISLILCNNKLVWSISLKVLKINK